MSTKRHCHHVKPNGIFCGSPAMRGHLYCYYHHEAEIRSRRRARLGGPNSNELDFGTLEDPSAIQVGIVDVLHRLADKIIDRPTATAMLYGLQLAMVNARQIRLKPGYRDMFVTHIDNPDTIDQFDLIDDEDEEEDNDQTENNDDADIEDTEDLEAEVSTESTNAGSSDTALVPAQHLLPAPTNMNPTEPPSLPTQRVTTDAQHLISGAVVTVLPEINGNSRPAISVQCLNADFTA